MFKYRKSIPVFNNRNSRLKFCSSFLISALLFALNINIFMNNYLNTLNNKNWNIVKDRLSHFAMGAYSFKYLYYIINGKLELNKFSGFNEIEFRENESDSLRFDKITFNLNLAKKNSYLYFIFKKNENGCYAFRFSNSELRDNCFMLYSPMMSKEKKVHIDYPLLKENKWYKIEVDFSPGFYKVYIDNKLFSEIKEDAFAKGKIAFRSGYERVLLDNIKIIGKNYLNERDGPVSEFAFYDNFESSINKPIKFALSLSFAVLFHMGLLFISFYLLKTLFNFNIEKSVLLFISLLKFLSFFALALFIWQVIQSSICFNNYFLFYFGQISLPSLRQLYLYLLGFIILFLYKCRNLNIPEAINIKFYQKILLILFFIYALPFFYNKKLMDSFIINKHPIKDIGTKFIKKDIILDYPMRIEQPFLAHDYSVYAYFKLNNKLGKLLFIIDGNKFIITAEDKIYSGFESVGAPNDFSFQYTKPKTRFLINENKYYQLKIIKSKSSLTAYLDGQFIDRKYKEQSLKTYDFLENSAYLFPIGGTPNIKLLSIEPMNEKEVYFNFIEIKEILKNILLMLFLFSLFFNFSKDKFSRISYFNISYAQLLLFLFPFFLLYYLFDSLLFTDRFFYLTLYYSYISLFLFYVYNKSNIRLIIFVGILGLIIFFQNAFFASKTPIDLQPARFSYFRFKKGFSEFRKPPQQLDAFLYNNNFDNEYKTGLLRKTKILLFGSSQAWGSGAAEKNLTIANYLETYLNNLDHSEKFRVINCGVNGANSLYLGNFFNNFLKSLNPKLILIDLSNNDYFFWLFSKFKKDRNIIYAAKNLCLNMLKGLDRLFGFQWKISEDEILDKEILDKNIQLYFKNTLIEKFIIPCKKNDIKILFVKEPNSSENMRRRETVFKMYSVLEELSLEYNIPVVSPQSTLDKYDLDNPLWWDFMHLSSLGQNILAKEIYDSILKNSLLKE